MKTIFSPSKKIVVLVFSVFMSAYLISNNSHPFLSCQKVNEVSKKDSAVQNIVPWRVPEVSEISNDAEGEQIRLGRYIFIHTYNYIGPDVKEPSKRFAGTNMDCQNCHFKGGTLKYVLGLVGTYNEYPKFDPRSNKTISIEQRINSCLTRSMNGKPMPENSEEMKALSAYLKWLCKYVPKGSKTIEQGLPKIQLISRAADTVAGKQVFFRKCTTCHAENGQGVLNRSANVVVEADSSKGYNFPPVFGNESYNTGAGMYRLIMSAAFIYTKMPYNDAVLSLDESYDVAAFINTKSRGVFRDVENDYPDLFLKPIDFPFPPFEDGFTQAQHKYGPYQPMLKEGEKSNMLKPE